VSGPRIWLVAGEDSGDQLGAKLMRALREAAPGVTFGGVGGEAMAEAGFTSLFPLDDVAVMGYLPVLARARTLGRRPFGFGRATPATVLVKAPKVGQDRRIDLPAIGARTVRNAARAGCVGLALEAGGTLVIDRAATAAEADRLGLFVVGYGGAP